MYLITYPLTHTTTTEERVAKQNILFQKHKKILHNNEILYQLAPFRRICLGRGTNQGRVNLTEPHILIDQAVFLGQANNGKQGANNKWAAQSEESREAHPDTK